jgi:hypothetical protein
MSENCTCPPDPPYEGIGIPVKMPGKSHRRGCPIVAPIFESMDEIAREHADAHVRTGGILRSPGEVEADRNRRRIEELERRIAALESGAPDEEAPAPEPVARWEAFKFSVDDGEAFKFSVVGGCVRTRAGVPTTRDECERMADALNALDRDGVAWGPGRPMSELPDGNHPRVLLRADGGPYVAANTYRSTDAEHKRLCWWPLPGEAQ